MSLDSGVEGVTVETVKPRCGDQSGIRLGEAAES